MCYYNYRLFQYLHKNSNSISFKNLQPSIIKISDLESLKKIIKETYSCLNINFSPIQTLHIKIFK